jgi:hypothetical protein
MSIKRLWRDNLDEKLKMSAAVAMEIAGSYCTAALAHSAVRGW